MAKPMTLSFLLVLGLALVPARAPADPPTPPPDAATLERLAARLAPVDLTANITALPPAERVALARLIEASKLMDALFLRQVWAGNAALLIDLQRDTTPLGRARLRAFMRTRGRGRASTRTSRSCPACGPKPPAANFYPAGATKAEIEAWLKSLPAARARRATGFFTTIRRSPPGALHAVPYSVEYQGELARAAGAAARGGAAATAADAARRSSTRARRRSFERLLRQRRGVDGAGRDHRAHHRPLRGLRRRAGSTPRQRSRRSSPSATTPRPRS